MNTKFDFSKYGIERKVYVRTVKKAELPDELRAEISSFDTVYAIHAEDGERLALVKDRDLAFDVARTNDFTPVSVH